MEYANEGDLRDFLRKNFHNMEWHQKLTLAFEITNGLRYLHREQIIHRDLVNTYELSIHYILKNKILLIFLYSKQHDKNIVISNGRAKITDFGDAKNANSQTNVHTNIFGLLPFIAPELLDSLDNSLYSTKTDIYSLGVLFWELTSGITPFVDCKPSPALALKIIKGKRENIVSGTSNEYCQLYIQCWNSNPNNRPDVEIVYLTLKKMQTSNTEQIIDKIKYNSDSNNFQGNNLNYINDYSYEHNANYS
jgi:serine/threonine protein kinase